MRPIHATLSYLAASTTRFASGLAGAGPWGVVQTNFSPNVGYKVTITSAGNLSALTFTLTLIDQNGRTFTEAVTGPNATTVSTTGTAVEVVKIEVSATTGATTFDVGNAAAGTVSNLGHKIFPLNYLQSSWSAEVQVVVSGTINYSVQFTDSDIYDTAVTPTWTDISALAGKTATTASGLTSPVRAIRVNLASVTAGAVLTLNVIQTIGH
jgi:hypothetical protein